MMRAISTQATVTPDGTVKIELPSTGLPAGSVEAVVILQPAVTSVNRPHSLRSGLFADLPRDFDIDAALHEIRHEWEKETEP